MHNLNKGVYSKCFYNLKPCGKRGSEPSDEVELVVSMRT